MRNGTCMERSMRTVPCLLTVATLTVALALPGCARRDAVRVTAAVVGTVVPAAAALPG